MTKSSTDTRKTEPRRGFGSTPFGKRASRIDWKRLSFVLLGVTLFLGVLLSPAWPDAIDPTGESFPLSPQGKAAIALFLFAAVWWVFEVVPIGVTRKCLR